MYVRQLVCRQREDHVAKGGQCADPIGCQFPPRVVVRIARRPALVDIPGLLSVFASVVSHGLHSDRSCAMLTARLSDPRRLRVLAIGWKGSLARLLYAGQQ